MDREWASAAGTDYDETNTSPGQRLHQLHGGKQPILRGRDRDAAGLQLVQSLSQINAMAAYGATNQAVGFEHGWKTLTPGSPYGAPAVPANTARYIIILSDGLNTEDRWWGNGSTEGTAQDNNIDTRMNAVCSAAKSGGIIVYSIYVNIGGTDGNSAPLQNCATDSTKYFALTTTSAVVTTFNQIAQQITDVRVVIRVSVKIALDVLNQILITLWHVMPWLAGAGLVFAALSRLSPCNQGRPWWEKRGLATDLAYWIFVPIFTRYLRIWVTVTFTVWLFHISDGQKIADFYANGHGPVAALPLWFQAVLYLVGTDFMLYWSHRVFHQGASVEISRGASCDAGPGLDQRGAVSSAQSHVRGCGRRYRSTSVRHLAQIFVVMGPVNTITSCLVHANLNWTFGPLRHVIASPVFHRWHHDEKTMAAISPAPFAVGLDVRHLSHARGRAARELWHRRPQHARRPLRADRLSADPGAGPADIAKAGVAEPTA